MGDEIRIRVFTWGSFHSCMFSSQGPSCRVQTLHFLLRHPKRLIPMLAASSGLKLAALPLRSDTEVGGDCGVLLCGLWCWALHFALFFSRSCWWTVTLLVLGRTRKPACPVLMAAHTSKSLVWRLGLIYFMPYSVRLTSCRLKASHVPGVVERGHLTADGETGQALPNMPRLRPCSENGKLCEPHEFVASGTGV